MFMHNLVYKFSVVLLLLIVLFSVPLQNYFIFIFGEKKKRNELFDAINK